MILELKARDATDFYYIDQIIEALLKAAERIKATIEDLNLSCQRRRTDGAAKWPKSTNPEPRKLWSATMPEYADQIRKHRLDSEAQTKISECKLRIRELKKRIKDAKIEIRELEAKIEELAGRN